MENRIIAQCLHLCILVHHFSTWNVIFQILLFQLPCLKMKKTRRSRYMRENYNMMLHRTCWWLGTEAKRFIRWRTETTPVSDGDEWQIQGNDEVPQKVTKFPDATGNSLSYNSNNNNYYYYYHWMAFLEITELAFYIILLNLPFIPSFELPASSNVALSYFAYFCFAAFSRVSNFMHFLFE